MLPITREKEYSRGSINVKEGIRFDPRDAMNFLMMFDGVNEYKLLENEDEEENYLISEENNYCSLIEDNFYFNGILKIKISNENIVILRNDNIFFEGILKFNQLDGNCKEYYFNNKIIFFEGNYKYGVKCGKGIMYHKNRNKEYEGNFKNNEYNGQGIWYHEDGYKIYKGEFKWEYLLI